MEELGNILIENLDTILTGLATVVAYVSSIYLLPEKQAKYLNILEKIAGFISLVLKKAEQTESGLSSKRDENIDIKL